MEPDKQTVVVSVPAWFSRLHAITGVGALAVVIGSFLPWATVRVFGTSVSKVGTEGDGKITLILGIAAMVALGIRKYGPALSGLVLLLSSCVAVYDIADTSRRAGDINGMSSAVHVSIGIGLWTVAVGSIGGLLAALTLAREQRNA